MASHCSSRFLLLLFLLSYSLPTFSLAKQTALFDSIYYLGDALSSSSSSIAATLNLPSPQTYNPQSPTQFFDSGLNFATPGATIMKPFFFLKNGITPPPLSHDQSQIVTFMNFFYNHCFSAHDCGKNKLLHKALVFMDQPGFNDYKHAFLHGKSISEASNLVPEVVETVKNSIERLIKEAEAKTVMVSGIPPMGCFPGFRTLFPEGDSIVKSRCHEALNMFAKLHNDHLWQAILELRLKYPDVHIIYADYYKAFVAVVRNHAFLGFKTKNLMKACGSSGAGTCSDRASYIHWDGFQLTPEASENLIDTLFSQRGFIFPEFKFGEENNSSSDKASFQGVRNMSSIVRHLLFV